MKGRLPWVLVAVAVGVWAPAAVASPTHQQVKDDLASWGSYYPKGWSAGSVTRGTGYWRPGASLRVREVQRRLNRLGYASGEVDGLFGPVTDAAVRRYQIDRRLELDGIVGPQTLKDLRSRTRRVQGSDRKTSSSEPHSGSRGTPEAAPRQDAAAGSTTRREAGRDAPATADRERPLVESIVLVAGYIALLLLAGVVVGAARGIPRAASVIRDRVRYGRGRDLYHTAYVEGISEDEQIGAFRGFAYIVRPMTGGEEPADEATSLVVYDVSRPKPVSVRLAEITAINGQPVGQAGRHPRPSRKPAPPVVSASKPSGMDPEPLSQLGARLRIVRRIEAPPPTRSRRRARPRSGTARRDRSRSGIGRRDRPNRAGHSPVHGGRSESRFRWVGARVSLADAEGVDNALTLPVKLELFAESERRRWETGVLETDEPLRVSVDDFEESVRTAVAPEWIPQLAAALTEAGMAIDAEELARLPFSVERSIEVERAIAGMEVISVRAS